MIEKKVGIIENIVGLWDSRIHETKPEPEIVFNKDDKRGVIIGYNEYEIIVEWEINGKRPQTMVRDIKDIKFKFVEDYNKYLKVFELIKKRKERRKGI